MTRRGSPAQRAADDARDWALIAAIGTGDQRALAALYKRHYDYLYRFVLRVTRRVDGVDDVVNEVMHIVWQQAAKAEPRALASTWILSIAQRCALKRMSRSGPEHDALDDEDPRVGADSAALQGVDAADLMTKALAVLPAEQRAVIALVYEQGLNYAEIAAVLGCPENTVKTRVFHARRKLRAVWPSLTGTPLSAAAEDAMSEGSLES